MSSEIIGKIEILSSGELALFLESGGKPSYQLVYREAAEISWDNELKAFTSPVPRQWSYSDWFSHILKVTQNCGISLSRSENTSWVNVPVAVKEEICAKST
ncbi:MAG: hypothetical protein HRT76_01765 [Halieaceae bacterium]|nr:hypothetical protein [Halieaceae bacterium]